MSIYYITTLDGDIFQLDASLNVSVNDPATLTSYKTQSGEDEADHYINENITVSVSGRISDVKSTKILEDRSKTTDEFITGLKALKKSKKRFFFTWREDRREGGSTYQLGNCWFTNLTFSQGSIAGFTGSKHSYEVSMDIKQSRVGQKAIVVIEQADFIQDTTSEKKNGRSGTTNFDDEELGANGVPLGGSADFWADLVSSIPSTETNGG